MKIESVVESLWLKPFWFFILLHPLFSFNCNAQGESPALNIQVETTQPELYAVPQKIVATDTSPGWTQPGQQLLITGIVLQNDGRTPAADVNIYYYHTNMQGKYEHRPEEKRSLPPNSKGQTHGYIRGWVKTGADGKYSIYTVRPGVYPTGDEPAHIHVTIKEPDMAKHYLIDEFVFDDDKLLTMQVKRKMENRGGTGVLRLLVKGNLQIAEHNIILGLNIPDYPKKRLIEISSGLQIGEDQPSFIPHHAYGPDKGSRACPVCKYGRYHGIIYFTGNKSNLNEVRKWLVFLERQSIERKKYLKVYFVFGNDKGYTKNSRLKELESLGEELRLKHIALTFVPFFADQETEVYLNRINPAVENTFVIYRNHSIIDKYINLKPTEQNFRILTNTLDKTKGDYYELTDLWGN